MTQGVFGRDYAAAYDVLYQDKDYMAECDLIENVFRLYGQSAMRRAFSRAAHPRCPCWAAEVRSRADKISRPPNRRCLRAAPCPTTITAMASFAQLRRVGALALFRERPRSAAAPTCHAQRERHTKDL